MGAGPMDHCEDELMPRRPRHPNMTMEREGDVLAHVSSIYGETKRPLGFHSDCNPVRNMVHRAVLVDELLVLSHCLRCGLGRLSLHLFAAGE